MNLFCGNRYHKDMLLRLALCLTAVVLAISMQTANAETKVMTRYVGIDLVNDTHETTTAYSYDENFNRFPDNPFIHNSSIEEIQGAFYFIGVNIDVVRRNPDNSVTVLSHDPAYAEMVHHMVWGYTAPTRNRDFLCGMARPIGAGGDLLNIHFPKGYGYKFEGGLFMPFNWHWKNPAGVEDIQNLYLRFDIITADVASGYKDTMNDRIDMLDFTKTGVCNSTFSVPPGKSKKKGAKHPVTSDRRILLAIPHIHDHSEYIKFKSDDLGTLWKMIPQNKNITVAHDDMGQGPSPWHAHKDHLPVDGLYNWAPGFTGLVVRAGDSLWLEAKFDNPHPRDIDNMTSVDIFWVPVEPGSVDPYNDYDDDDDD